MIIIVGCGTLGSRVAGFLSKQELTFIDHDIVMEKNLPYQQFSSEDVGKSKAVVLAERTRGHAHAVFIDHTNIAILKEAEVVVDCTDNLLTRALLGAYCFGQGIPLVHGAAAGDRGIACLFDGKPCMASLYAGKVSVDTCRSADINPSVAEQVARKQGELARRALLGEGHSGVYLLTAHKERVVELSERTHEACTKELPQTDWYITFCTQANCMSAKRNKPIDIETGLFEIDGVKLEVLTGGEIHFHTEEEADILETIAKRIYESSGRR